MNLKKALAHDDAKPRNMKEKEAHEIRKLRVKLEKYFIKKPAKKKILQYKDTKLRVEYMWGARYMILKKKGKNKPVLLATLVTSQKAAEIIHNQKQVAKGSIHHKLKGLI